MGGLRAFLKTEGKERPTKEGGIAGEEERMTGQYLLPSRICCDLAIMDVPE